MVFYKISWIYDSYIHTHTVKEKIKVNLKISNRLGFGNYLKICL